MNEKSDSAAHRELDRLLAEARERRVTGQVVLEVHLRDGVPATVKSALRNENVK